VGNCHGRVRQRLGGDFGWRFQHWFEGWRALTELAGRHGIDAVGGRCILRLVLGFNLLDWRRRGDSDLLRNDRLNSFESLCNLRDVGFSYALLIEFLNGLHDGRGCGRLKSLLGDGCGCNGNVVAKVGVAVASALAAGIAVISVGSGFASRLPLEVARRPVASLS
jgi:hypothetical protein